MGFLWRGLKHSFFPVSHSLWVPALPLIQIADGGVAKRIYLRHLSLAVSRLKCLVAPVNAVIIIIYSRH